MRPTDLAHLVIPSDPQWHPDGQRLVFVETRVELDDDRSVSCLMLHDGETVRGLTQGPGDTTPRWSPDGSTLAFLRTGTEDDARPQLALLPADGGEARVVTDLSCGVSDLAWAPDGRSLVIVGATWVAELAGLEDDERRRRPRRITRLPYRADGSGWVHERHRQLWLVDAADPEADPRPLTTGTQDVVAPAWHPDGDRIAAVTRPEGLPEWEPHDEVVTVDVTSGEVRRHGITGAWSWVGFDPAGALHVAGMPEPFDWPGVQRIWRAETPTGTDDPTAEPDLIDLTGYLDRDVLPGSPGLDPMGPRFLQDGFLTGLEDAGRTSIVRITPTSGAGVADVVVGGARSVTGFAVHPDGATLAVTWTDPTTPGELVVVRDGAPRRVTGYGERFRDAVDLAPTERWTIDRDAARVDAWSVLPAGFADAPDRSVPVLLNIHGGPTAQYGDYFFDEFQVEAGAGYLVVGTNPRGSSGRGTDWARAVVGVWHDPDPVDLQDLRAVLDAVLARYPQADPARVGIMGGSYGGYAVARLLVDDDRYASAVVERGLLEWGSFSGTSDIGTYFDRMFLDASFPDDADRHHAASPVFTAGRVTTPTLVLHSEHDWRCPIEQAERYFVALKRAGVTTEFVRFPDEGHELSRSGSPKHRVERFEAILDWHGRFLGDAATAEPTGDAVPGRDEAVPMPPTAPDVPS